MRAIKSFIKEALLEADVPESSEPIQDDLDTLEQGARSALGAAWEEITSSGSSLAAWLDEKIGRAKTEIDKAEDSAGKTAEEADAEFESYVGRGMSTDDWQLFSAEEAILSTSKREQIRQDVDTEFANLGTGAGAVITDNEVINFRHGIKNLLQKDFGDSEINYPYRTAFYIIAYERGIYTFGDAFSNIMENTASALALPFMVGGLAFEEPAGGDPSKDDELTNTEIVGLSVLGVAFSGTLIKFLGHLLGEVATEAGLKKILKNTPLVGQIFSKVSRTRVQDALKDTGQWNELVTRLRSESYAAAGKKSIVDVINAWFRSYKDGINYSKFASKMILIRSFANLFSDDRSVKLVVYDANPDGSLAGRTLGDVKVKLKDLSGLSSIDDIEEFVFEFARRFLYLSLEESSVQKAAKGVPGTAEKFLKSARLAEVFSAEFGVISELGPARQEFIEFADFLDAIQRTPSITSEKNDFASMLSSRIESLYAKDSGAIEYTPSLSMVGKDLPETVRISTNSPDLPPIFDQAKKGINNMLSLSEDLAEPAAQLTMWSKFFRFARTTVAGEWGLVRALKLSLASAGVIEFATILAGDDEAITLLQSTIIATGAAIRKDAYDAFVDIRQDEPDINIMGIAKNAGIATRIEGKFQDADKELSNLLRRPVGDPDNDAGPDDMTRIRELYEQALVGTVASVAEQAGWVAAGTTGAILGFVKGSRAVPGGYPGSAALRLTGGVAGAAAGGIIAAQLGAAGVRVAEENLGAGAVEVPAGGNVTGAARSTVNPGSKNESFEMGLLKTLIRNIL